MLLVGLVFQEQQATKRDRNDKEVFMGCVFFLIVYTSTRVEIK